MNKTLEFFRDKYEDFNCLLLYFLEDTYYSGREDIETVRRFVSVPTFDKQDIQSTIDQGKKILSLKEFPTVWVCTSVWGGGGTADGDKEKCKAWLQRIVVMLEEESLKAWALKDKYSAFYSLLLCLNEAYYKNSYSSSGDTHTIKEFVASPNHDKLYIQSVVKQGKEMLALPEFPVTWVWFTARDEGGSEHYKKKCKPWLTRIIRALEKEAKRVGKL